jgi:hypothetical protein
VLWPPISEVLVRLFSDLFLPLSFFALSWEGLSVLRYLTKPAGSASGLFPANMGRARVEDDNWFGVQDPRKRKQIQDRLAQRARSWSTHRARRYVVVDFVHQENVWLRPRSHWQHLALSSGVIRTSPASLLAASTAILQPRKFQSGSLRRCLAVQMDFSPFCPRTSRTRL